MTDVETGLIQLGVYIGGVILAIAGTKRIESRKRNGVNCEYLTTKDHALICAAAMSNHVLEFRDFVSAQMDKLREHVDGKIDKLESKIDGR